MRARKLLMPAGLLSVGLFLGTAAISPAASVSPTTINFGSVNLGSASAPIAVTATVAPADTKRQVLFSVNNQTYFKPASSQATCTGVPDPNGQLPPGTQSCTLNVVFQPSSTAVPGPAAGSVEARFSSGSGTDTVLKIPLAGTVVGPSGKSGKKCKKGKKSEASAAKKKKCGKKK